MRPIALGIIGYGRIGAEHSAWLNQCDEVSLRGVADVTEARRALAESRGLRTCDSLDDLLRMDAEAILIATPTAMHFDQAMAALRAGKHVMIEKPMALDLAQSRQLVEEARGRKLVLSVFHNRRWDIDYLTVKSAVDSGVFGRIINLESRLSQWASCVGPAAREYRPGWRNEGAFGGGGLYDWGSHFVDQLWRLLLPARPMRVFAQLRANVWSSNCDDFARVLIDFDNGAAGLVEINTTTNAPLPRWHIDGTRGSAEGPYSLEFDTRKWARLLFSPSSGTPGEGRGGGSLPLAPPGLSEVDLWRAFARAIRDGSDPAVPAESVLPTMALLDAARESSATGQAVEL